MGECHFFNFSFFNIGNAVTDKELLIVENLQGIFNNKGDTLHDLEFILKEYFEDVNVWREGFCAAWKCSNPRIKPEKPNNSQ